MEIFSSSRDLVNLALSLGIIGISAAIVYFFISAAGFIREMRQTIDEINRQLENINQITEVVKNKISYMFSYWSILEKLANKAINLLQKGLVDKVKSRFHRYATTSDFAQEDQDNSNDLSDNNQKSKAKQRTKKQKS